MCDEGGGNRSGSSLPVLRNDVGKGFAILNVGANGFGRSSPAMFMQAAGRFDLTFDISGGLLLVGSVLTRVMTHHPIGARGKSPLAFTPDDRASGSGAPPCP
jgi:hypothetical protein